ncbi:PRO1 [Cyberlindnera jadinii]|uniref:Glutamate 5-kinase n=1 Tax=Cyberlindnera jadinii (strain ATCC 18201 / CBS 1600 / BCRC 20928 / JCM 3617 / NBRC 0987 / NRRL Y-1542) TaxID=983966 RepID=A0A0H5CAW2_CYBJN|nr:glutamate 5-kinase [Cyberlindnera jadinii NRRL Y-1542]ODV76408.1 glutamate 5-kinase [Cyberlindnera jadinii NRRL Y-1542]CEP21049.1 PRO1 [Cyberlindnera jadinii]
MGKGSTIVIKLGTSSLVDEVTKEPRLATMSLIVETVVKLRRAGHRVVIVSSGGIAVGLKTMGLDRRPKKLAQVQALAAIGQSKLIGRWDSLFAQLGQRIAQILITRNDISDWTQYKNAQNTMQELLDMGVVPIVNENDTLSVAEIKFGDNDTLSAITSALIKADYLFLMTDVDCLYTANPRTDPLAKPILIVDDMSALNVDTSSSGSDVGTGGMTTKLIAADLATEAGTTMIIMKSERPENLWKIVEYISNSDDDVLNGLTIEDRQVKELEKLKANDVPLHTRFIGYKQHVKNREFWMLHGLHSHGALIIDQGAHQALTRTNKAGLLPVGIIGVVGHFHEHECVALKAGFRSPDGSWDSTRPVTEIGRARVNYGSVDIEKIKGRQSHEIEDILGYHDSEYIAHRDNLAFPPSVLEKSQSSLNLVHNDI